MESSPHPDRVLIVRPSALGDVCRTVPVLASLRRAWPDATIDWVVQDTFLPAIAAHPALAAAIPFPRRRFARWWRSPSVALDLVGWFRDLGRRGYDVVFDCQGLGRSGLITRATGAPRRIGARGAREASWLAYTARHPIAPGRHAVDAMLDLLEAEGITPIADAMLYVPDEDRAWWSERRSHDAPYAVIAPTARWASKRWPAERWAALLGPLRERGFERIVAIGAPGERDQVAEVRAASGDAAGMIVDVAPEATIGRTMAIIADASVVVAHDSAPLHMAVGFDRPCVGLFGPTDPAIVGPWRRPEAVVRAAGAPDDVRYRDRGLGDRLMRDIPLDAVVARLDAVLATDPVVETARSTAP